MSVNDGECEENDGMMNDIQNSTKDKRKPKKRKLNSTNSKEDNGNESSRSYFFKEEIKESLSSSSNFALRNLFGSEKKEEEVPNERRSEKISFTKAMNVNSKPRQQIFFEQAERLENEETPLVENIWWKPGGTHESFFFTDDDQRLVDGTKFVSSSATVENEKFNQIRSEVKTLLRIKKKRSERNVKKLPSLITGYRRRKPIRKKKKKV